MVVPGWRLERACGENFGRDESKGETGRDGPHRSKVRREACGLEKECRGVDGYLSKYHPRKLTCSVIRNCWMAFDKSTSDRARRPLCTRPINRWVVWWAAS